MPDRRRALRRLRLTCAGLAAFASAGFLLAACGGGDGTAVTTRTGVTVTRPAVTATLPAVTQTRPNETTPIAPPPTTTSRQPPPPPPQPPPPTTVAATEPSSTSSTPWGWIALAAGLAVASIVGILLWRRRRAHAASWSAQLADLSRRSLVALDAVLADGSVVTGQVQALAAEARSLETHAPDDPSKEATARLRAALGELARALEADRTLRLSSPPPSAEQLSYSTALIHQHVEALQRVLRIPSHGPPPA